jgi:hypothetical protein
VHETGNAQCVDVGFAVGLRCQQDCTCPKITRHAKADPEQAISFDQNAPPISTHPFIQLRQVMRAPVANDLVPDALCQERLCTA